MACCDPRCTGLEDVEKSVRGPWVHLSNLRRDSLYGVLSAKSRRQSSVTSVEIGDVTPGCPSGSAGVYV